MSITIHRLKVSDSGSYDCALNLKSHVVNVVHTLQIEGDHMVHPHHLDPVSVDQAGSERTEAGESALSRHEDSPRPGRAKCELCETLQDLIMGAGEEASLNLPCLLILASSWTARPSRSYSSELQATRGTLCCSAILPF